MQWLESLSTPELLIGSVLIVAGAAMGLFLLMHRQVPEHRRESTGATAASYMTALGSLFAILTGFLINAQFQSLSDTQNLVGQERAAGIQLAYSTEGLPGSDVSLVQDALANYLAGLKRNEWQALASGQANRSQAVQPLAELQQRVFTIASHSYVSSSSVEGMRTAVSELVSLRGQRVQAAEETVPLGLFLLAVLAGLALIANAGVVTLRGHRWDSIVATGIVLIVALDLALIVSLSGPFQGPLQVSAAPLDQLSTEVSQGQYLPWVGATPGGGNSTAPASTDTNAICRADRFGCVTFGIGDPIKLGALLWLGPGADKEGIDSERGIELAIDYLDGTFDGVPGQVLGHQVQVAAADDGCDTQQGLAGAKTLGGEPGIIGVVGTTCSASATTAAPYLSKKGVLLVSPSNTAPSLTTPFAGQPFYARTAANDAIQGAVASDFVAGPTATASGTTTRALVVQIQSAYSTGLAGVFGRNLAYLGGKENVITLQADDPTSKVVAALRSAATTHPDVVYFPVIAPLCQNVIAAIASLPELAGTKWLTSDACLTSDTLTAAEASGAQIFASGPDLTDLQGKNPFYSDQYLPAYVEQYGQEPPAIYNANAFDAANVILDALRRTAIVGPGGTLVVPRTALRNALFQTNGYPGVSGTLQCQPTGDCAQAALISVYESPNWPVQGGPGETPVYKEYKTLAQVLANS